jgi:hypothetical protein
MYIPRFNRPNRPTRWTERPAASNVQTFDFAPYEQEVIGHPYDTAEAERQLAHANGQLELTRHYPGRDRNR